MICFPTDSRNADKKIYVDEETGGGSLSSVFSYSASASVILRKYPAQIVYDQNGRPFMFRMEDTEAAN